MDKYNENWSYYRVFKNLEVILTGVVSINHYTRLLANLVPRASPSKSGWGGKRFWGKSPGDEVGLLASLQYVWFVWFLFQDCAFNKLQSNSALRVSFQGNMRVDGLSSKSNRWYFKFNGNECSGPMTIEAVVYNSWPSGNPNLLHHRSFEGYCENIPQGAVRVELLVGHCSGYTLGDAHTGWNSVSRIMIKEVSRPQS